MTTSGRPRFNALALGEVTVNFMGATLTMKCKAAFVDQETGNTHAWTTSEGPWSEGTVETLRELRMRMEEDLGAIHFEGGTVSPTARPTAGPPTGGIGEHLSEDGTQI